MSDVMWSRAKRPTESVLAAAALACLSPVLALIAFAIRKGDGGPALFRQVRAGREGRPFSVYKFRSMVVDADRLLDEAGNPTAPQVTPVGAVLRRYSLDELPQLMNVVKGDMALVGPRPVPIEYVAMMSPRQRERHRVRPGLTGLAQVTGRHGLKWSERVELDLAYIDDFSFRADLAIVLKTVRAVFRSDVLIERGDFSKVDLG